jgi:hypothetical protein
LGRYRDKDFSATYRVKRSKDIHLKSGGSPKNKDLPHPEVIISKNAQNDDLILDYFQDDNRLAQEIISGHTIARVSVEFPLPLSLLEHQ